MARYSSLFLLFVTHTLSGQFKGFTNDGQTHLVFFIVDQVNNQLFFDLYFGPNSPANMQTWILGNKKTQYVYHDKQAFCAQLNWTSNAIYC